MVDDSSLLILTDRNDYFSNRKQFDMVWILDQNVHHIPCHGAERGYFIFYFICVLVKCEEEAALIKILYLSQTVNYLKMEGWICATTCVSLVSNRWNLVL